MIYKGEITWISKGRDRGPLDTTLEFIEIGGRRVHNVVCSDLIHTFLDRDSGEFTLSTMKSGKWRIIMAIRRPNGELIKDKGQLRSIRLLFLVLWMGGFVMAIPFGLLASSWAVFFLIWLGVAFGYPLVRNFKASKAANALNSQA